MGIAEDGDLLDLVRATVGRVGRRLSKRVEDDAEAYSTSAEYPREVKSLVDEMVEREVLAALSPTGISVLSEEAGFLKGADDSDRCLIVDPLDGTYNYLHGLGPWAVSVALWRNSSPTFGAVYSSADDAVFWGGPGLGAYRDDVPIVVSETSDRSRASICTGVPARVDIEATLFRRHLWELIDGFGKVRMLGSAAISLVRVAAGAADAYCEDGIMIWDVAAGLAIVEGAGGRVVSHPGAIENSVDVFASNGRLEGQTKTQGDTYGC